MLFAGLVVSCLLKTFSKAQLYGVQVALRAIVGSIARDDSLVTEVREAFEGLERGHAGSVSNSILLQVMLQCCRDVD